LLNLPFIKNASKNTAVFVYATGPVPSFALQLIARAAISLNLKIKQVVAGHG
jgi:hypothetical protein